MAHSRLNTILLMLLTALATIVWWSLQTWTYHVDSSIGELEEGRRQNAQNIAKMEGTLQGMQEADRVSYESILRVDAKLDSIILQLKRK